MPQSPQPTSGQAEPVKAAASRGKSPKRAAAKPRAAAPARQGKPPARARPTRSAKPAAPVTRQPAQPTTAPGHDASARRAKRSDPSPTPSTQTAASSSVEPSAAPVEQNGNGGAGTPAIAAPARSGTGWTCEIGWRAGLRTAAFRATAAQPGGDPQEIARSSPVQWPPVIPPLPEPDIEEALLALEQRLVAAGWTPINPVRPEWFRRRFAWTKAKPPRPLPSTPGLDCEWTSEIVWKAGLRDAGFYARATASGERKQIVVARSPKLKWPPLFPPIPIDELVSRRRDRARVDRVGLEAGRPRRRVVRASICLDERRPAGRAEQVTSGARSVRHPRRAGPDMAFEFQPVLCLPGLTPAPRSVVRRP